MALKVKLLSRGKSVKPYVSSVQTSGKVQKAFKEQIGDPVGACVKSGVHEKMKQSEIRDVVRNCARGTKGTKLRI